MFPSYQKRNELRDIQQLSSLHEQRVKSGFPDRRQGRNPEKMAKDERYPKERKKKKIHRRCLGQAKAGESLTDYHDSQEVRAFDHEILSMSPFGFSRGVVCNNVHWPKDEISK